MKIDSLLKGIWIAVGSLLLVLILVGIFYALGLNHFFRSDRPESGVSINNEEKDNVEKLTFELSYGTPDKIANSSCYLMRVNISYKETARKVSAGFDSYEKEDRDVNDPSNIIFLDSTLKPIRVLLDTKALITDLTYPYDSDEEYEVGSGLAPKSIKHIFYEIVTQDSNENEELDREDNADLYISRLDGSELQKITFNWNIQHHEFLDNYKTLLIRYTDRNDASKKIAFAKYSIQKKEMTLLSEINTSLKTIEEILK